MTHNPKGKGEESPDLFCTEKPMHYPRKSPADNPSCTVHEIMLYYLP